MIKTKQINVHQRHNNLTAMEIVIQTVFGMNIKLGHSSVMMVSVIIQLLSLASTSTMISNTMKCLATKNVSLTIQMLPISSSITTVPKPITVFVQTILVHQQGIAAKMQKLGRFSEKGQSPLQVLVHINLNILLISKLLMNANLELVEVQKKMLKVALAISLFLQQWGKK